MEKISRRKTLKALALIGISTVLPIQLPGKIKVQTCEVCKKAWNRLSKFNRTRYQFRYIEPVPGLPKVFLYGDSISIGYTEYVRASLQGKANVYRLHVNGGSSDSFIQKMEQLRKAMFQPYLENGWDFQWDIIHFNVGLHDLKYVLNGKLNLEEGSQVSSLDTYRANLQSIIKYLKETYPGTTLIFATTTPVPEGAEGRMPGDVAKYNKVALEVMKEHHEILVNDLYTFAVPMMEKYAIKPNNVHFSDEGSRLLGIEVAENIADALNTESNACPSVETINNRAKEYVLITKKQ